MARKRTVGFIGLGAMGTAVAGRLIEAGWPLVVYNRTANRTRPLAEKGAAVAGSPREVAETSDIVITILSDDKAVRDVVFGGDGVFAGMKSGQVLVDMTTASPELAMELESAGSGIGVKTLDVRLSGSIEPAQKGDLLILVGGEQQVFNRVCPVLDVLGRKIVFTGGHGSAAMMKVALNIILGLEMEALAEAYVLAKKSGLAPDVISEVINSSGVASPLIKSKLKMIRSGNFERQFSLRLMQKDFRLALDEGERQGTPLPSTAAANETAIAGLANGLGEHDLAALYLAVALLAGVRKEADTRQFIKEPAQAI